MLSTDDDKPLTLHETNQATAKKNVGINTAPLHHEGCLTAWVCFIRHLIVTNQAPSLEFFKNYNFQKGQRFLI